MSDGSSPDRDAASPPDGARPRTGRAPHPPGSARASDINGALPVDVDPGLSALRSGELPLPPPSDGRPTAAPERDASPPPPVRRLWSVAGARAPQPSEPDVAPPERTHHVESSPQPLVAVVTETAARPPAPIAAPSEPRTPPRPPAAASSTAGAAGWQTRDRLWALIGRNKKTVALLGLCSFLSGLCEAIVLAVVAEVAFVLAKHETHLNAKLGPVHIHAPLGSVFLVMLVVVLMRTALQFPLSRLPARISATVQAHLRKDLFGAFTRASWAVQSRDREGTLQETLTSQVLQATAGALQTSQLIISAIVVVVLMVSAVVLSPLAAVAVLFSGGLMFALLRPLNALGVTYARALSRSQLDFAAGVSEASRLAQETQVFGVEGPQRQRVFGLVDRAEALFLRAQFVGRLAPGLYQMGIYLFLVVGLWALYVAGAHFTALAPAVILIIRSGTYGQQVQGSYQQLRQSLPFIERLQNAARRYDESTPSRGDEPLAEADSLAMRELSFSYTPERPVLNRLTFAVSGGEAIGVVGPSGAGKSTLIQILLQLRSPDSGQYLVNGIPADHFRPEDWNRKVAFVPQEPRLIHASLTDNIRYYRDISQADVERAARLARIHDDITAWPQGYATIVGPRADAVSGGQQQRICLARALAARPTVLVLDEPTSALDPHSETLIQESLRSLRQELTLFVIAHRLSTLDVCDRVMVIVDGELVAFETQEELERGNQYFRSASALAAGGRLP